MLTSRSLVRLSVLRGAPHHGHFQAVAELAAAILARLYGAPQDGHSYDYLARYAGQVAGDVYGLCLSVLGDVEDLLRFILDMADVSPDS